MTLIIVIEGTEGSDSDTPKLVEFWGDWTKALMFILYLEGMIWNRCYGH